MHKAKLMIGAAATALALVLLPITAASAGGLGWGAFGHHGRHLGHPTPGAAVVNIENGPYGPVLVVGGAGAGYIPATSTTVASYAYPAGTSLYFATVDPPTNGASAFHEYQAACTTTVVDTESEGSLSCTGSETDPTADWPAFTTNGFPIAGRGVIPGLLGAVYRPDLGTFQVTYAGHPLYLFDPGPDSFFGANFYETVEPLPPWNTAWYLLTPWGTPASGPATLETESEQLGTTYSGTELAAAMLPNAVPGGAAVSVYTFSGDQPYKSTCYGACARTFIPLYTVGPPTVATGVTGVNAIAIGVIRRADGSEQVTYHGHPLYLYSQEQPLAGSGGLITDGSAGNGEGVSGFGGTLSLVTP